MKLSDWMNEQEAGSGFRYRKARAQWFREHIWKWKLLIISIMIVAAIAVVILSWETNNWFDLVVVGFCLGLTFWGVLDFLMEIDFMYEMKGDSKDG